MAKLAAECVALANERDYYASLYRDLAAAVQEVRRQALAASGVNGQNGSSAITSQKGQQQNGTQQHS